MILALKLNNLWVKRVNLYATAGISIIKIEKKKDYKKIEKQKCADVIKF